MFYEQNKKKDQPNLLKIDGVTYIPKKSILRKHDGFLTQSVCKIWIETYVQNYIKKEIHQRSKRFNIENQNFNVHQCTCCTWILHTVTNLLLLNRCPVSSF